MAAAQAQAQFDAYLATLAFMPDHRGALTFQGVNSLTVLKDMTDTEIHDMCTIIRRQVVPDPNNPANFGPPVAISISHERTLKLVAYYLRHLERTQRPFDANTATIARIREMQDLIDQEKEAKDKKVPALDKLESVAKIRATIENIDNHLSKLRGTSGVPLSYITRDNVIPLQGIPYANDIDEMIARAPHAGRHYRKDNEEVWHVIRKVLYDSDGWSWVSTYESAKDGRSAYLAVKEHYLGTTNQSLIKTTADMNIENTFYDGDKRGFTFERYCQIHKQSHKDLADYGEIMSEDRKVRKFLQGITASKLETPKATVIATDHLIGSFDNTVNFFTRFIVDWIAAS